MSTSVRAVFRPTPGALAPVRVMLSQSIFAYSAPSAPVAGTSRLRRGAVYTRCLRCACASMPRRPSTGSELSLMVFRNMSSSETTGNFPAALTQYFTGNIGLRHGINVSAFPSSSHSDPGEECISRLDYGSFALRPVALLVLLSEQTRLASSRRGRLHPGFQRLGHPRRRRICLQCQLGNLHWRDSHPLDHQLASLHYPGALIHIAAPPAGPRAFPATQERSMQPGQR